MLICVLPFLNNLQLFCLRGAWDSEGSSTGNSAKKDSEARLQEVRGRARTNAKWQRVISLFHQLRSTLARGERHSPNNQVSHPCESSYPLMSMQDFKLDLIEQLCTLSLCRGAPRWAGWKSLPERGFLKAPLSCQQLPRGVCNNIADILVKVRGSGVKVRFWTPPFGRGILKSFRLFLSA